MEWGKALLIFATGIYFLGCYTNGNQQMEAIEIFENETQILITFSRMPDRQFGLDKGNQSAFIKEPHEKGFAPSIDRIISIRYNKKNGRMTLAWRQSNGDQSIDWENIDEATWERISRFAKKNFFSELAIIEE